MRLFYLYKLVDMFTLVYINDTVFHEISNGINNLSGLDQESIEPPKTPIKQRTAIQ